MKKIGIILSGCGVYDGSEIQEAVFTMLSIARHGAGYVCYAPNTNQHHVVNHITGQEMTETRNTLVEAARIARGEIKDLAQFSSDDIDGLVIPGGFGAAKNLTQWAFSGPKGEIHPEVKRAINECVMHNKPVAGLCMGPTVIAKALEGTSVNAQLTVGTTAEKSPYEIQAISDGMNSIGASAVMKSIREVSVDQKNKIVTAPCYMMEAGITEVHDNIEMAISELMKMV